MTKRFIRNVILLLAVATSACARGPERDTAPVKTGEGVRVFEPMQTGPPAPAPAAVAILRPTQAELEQVNATLQRFIDMTGRQRNRC